MAETKIRVPLKKVMEQQWYDHRYDAHREIAIEWCDDNGFEYYEENDK